MPNPQSANMIQLTDLTMERLMAHLMRIESVFLLARPHLKPEHISCPGEIAQQLIWRGLLDYYDKYESMPARSALEAIVLSAVERTPGATEADHTAALSIIEWAFSLDESELHVSEATDLLRMLLIEREAGQTVRNAIFTAGKGPIRNLPKLLESMHARVEAISSLGKIDDSESTMPSQWAIAGRPKWPTGVDFIDSIMCGGSEPGDCNIIIGPTSGGKTTLSMQLACSIARRQHFYATRPNSDMDPGIVVFFSWEDTKRMLQIRAASYSAYVLKDTLRFLKSDDELTTAGRLAPYEEKLYSSTMLAADRLGERERLEQARPWLNKHLALIDYSSSGAKGYVPDVRQKLFAIQQKTGLPIRAVFLDWAGDMVRSYLLATNGKIDGGAMALELAGLVQRCKDEIAGPFNTTVWIPHQLAGRFCKLSPGRTPHHSEAQWCTSFADNAWYAFCLGVKDEEHNVCQLVASKTRHGAPSMPTILRIEGETCRLVDVSKHFAIDRSTQQIISSNAASRVFGANVTPGATPRPYRRVNITKADIEALE